ncbi:MAG: CinA family protein [Candidatus Omnitrophica bacterium]|nr:CinA family protein [Candidatus Omnitrophota bacterium]MDD5430112.1 CinA family protein [Candidatus Omnitrophota bacterium]
MNKKLSDKLIRLLENQKLSLAIAESCSGGYASYLITKTPGSSKVFKGGIIVYSLYSKNILLGIRKPLLEETKGVSKEVAKLLAKNIKKKFKAGVGASIVGFAGPESYGKMEKGTVFISIDYKGSHTKKIVIAGSRDAVRKKASNLLLGLICKRIKL